MNHDDIVLWLDENSQKFVEQFVASDAVVSEKIWELPVGEKRIEGYIDLGIQFVTDHGRGYRGWLCFEAKTKIESVGQVIRQIRLYKSWFNAIYVVACPDNSHEKLIESQGIRFLIVPGRQHDLKF